MGFLSELPLVGGMFDDSQDQAMAQYKKNQDLYNQYQPPELSYGNYNPQQYQYQSIDSDPAIRSMQLSALNKMGNLADTGLSDVDKATFSQAQEQANQQARGSREAIQQNAMARGMGGSGLQFAMQEQGNEAANQRAHDQNLQQASDSARQRALYTQAYGSGLQGLRGQDTDIASRNANIANQFNQMNTSSANQAQLQNINNQFNAGQQNWQNRMNWMNGSTGANNQMARGYEGISANNQESRNAGMNTLSKVGGAMIGGPVGAALVGGQAGGQMMNNYYKKQDEDQGGYY